jgi:integrase
MHDLRHAFAVNTLIGWYRDETDVNAAMPYLSAYLGHIDPSSTYWYLTGSPELARVIAARLDAVVARGQDAR